MIDRTGLSDWEKTKIYEYNNMRRDRLIAKVEEQQSSIERIKFIVDYFTNNLNKETVAEIDNVQPNEVVDFKYDYSYVKGNETPFDRRSPFVSYPLGRGVTISCVDRDVEVPGKPKIFPTIFALKMGTCIMFANEIKRLMSKIDIPCEIIITPTPVDCYDYFDGTDVEGNKINVNTIKPIIHAYNIITVDGKQFKIDIAGYLTAKDYNKNHPEGQVEPINCNQFCLIENIANNPFEDAKIKTT